MCLLTETRALSAQGEKRALVGNLTMPARDTIANVLKERGLEPAPERKKRTTWREFLGNYTYNLTRRPS